mgnify:CR=1 FL=1
MKAVAKQKHRKAKVFTTWHKESIFIILKSGNAHFFVCIRLAVIMARKCDFLEEEFSLGCPLFIYEDTTPTIIRNV